MKINAIPPNHFVLLTTYNSVYVIIKLKKSRRIRVAVLATSNLEFILNHPWMLELHIATYQGLVHPNWGRINSDKLEKTAFSGACWQYDRMGFQGVTVTSEIVNVSEEPIHISRLQTSIKDGGPIGIHLCTRSLNRDIM